MPSTEPRGPSPRPDPGEDLARLGSIIDGRYRLDRLLGRGGMGVVYEAEHVAIRRALAVKLLHPTLAAVPELRSRFEREAIAIGRIDHPNCVDVSDFGALDDGTLFLVMELLSGHSLGDLMDAEAPLTPVRALRILRHVLAGLGHAHAAGIVHRDVKPENVHLVSTEHDPEFAKILDFGIAKMIDGTEVDGGHRLTQAGVAFGTPVYMSPEQALGNPLDGRSDLYGASVMAYEMICGRPPFWADDKLEILSMHTTRPPTPMTEMLAQVRPSAPPVPPAVEEVIFKGLAKKREERWQTAAEYIAAVDRLLDVLTRPAHPMPTDPPHAGAAAGPVGPLDARRFGQPAALRDQRPRRPRPLPSRRTIAIVALVGAAALGVLIALLISGPSSKRERRLDPATPAGMAQAQLEQGDPAAAIKIIKSAGKAASTDADAQLLLGHAYAAQRKNDDAVAAYRRAVDIDPLRVADSTLRANLRTFASDTDIGSAMAALELLVRAGDDGARAKVIEAAEGPDAARRGPAAALAEKLDLTREIDWLQSYLYDLEQGDVCAQRRKAVAKLRALGDKRAVPALQKALLRKGKVGRWKGKNVNECLAADARAAIAYLDSLAGP